MTRGCNDFDASIIHYEAIGRGGFEIETFLGYEMATSDASVISAAIVFLRSLDFPKSRLGPAMKNLARAACTANPV